MANCSFISYTDVETKALGKRLANALLPGDILTLDGDLGAGKTTFTQGIAEGLEISAAVDSPTFTIIKEYNGRLALYHMDLYRIEGEGCTLGLDDYFYGQGVCVIEWPSRIQKIIPKEAIRIEILHRPDNSRVIQIVSTNERSRSLCKELNAR